MDVPLAGTLAYGFLPGALYGVTSVVLGYPLDTVKTRMQTVKVDASRGLLPVFRSIVQGEGMRALYRGVWTSLPVHGSKRAVQFYIFESLTTHGFNMFVCGAFSGVCGTLISCPLHVMKLQMQNSTSEEIINTWACCKSIWRDHGWSGFYRGVTVHLPRDAFFASMYLGTYGTLRKGEAIPIIASAPPFLNAAVASMITWTVCYPIDTLKTCVQCKASPWEALTEIRQGGPRRMFKGLGPTLLRAGPVSGISATVYEALRAQVSSMEKKSSLIKS